METGDIHILDIDNAGKYIPFHFYCKLWYFRVENGNVLIISIRSYYIEAISIM